MELSEKKIYLVLSPHINYYHSYRGDSLGYGGFGKDLYIMETILDHIDDIEDKNIVNGGVKIAWDYADTFFSIQLQKEYQQEVFDRVIERCKQGKDEMILGSWGNAGRSFLDTEEFIQDHNWLLENSMGIGLKQLVPNRIAPYARVQETMFTQGMIELYKQLGVEGIGIYYSVIPFDVARPFINPRLTYDQMFSPIRFNSTVSEESMLMLPMYGFGDVLDHYSITKWIELIREKQTTNEISGHALLFLNFDMDAETWIGISVPKLIQWMPNTDGLYELIEAVSLYDYLELANLLDVVPKLKIAGETELREDVADGCFNGYYNWSQKYNNTKFWTFGQQSRWLKCIADTIVEKGVSHSNKAEIDELIRGGNDQSNSYIRSKILLASTTNFGMSMPFQHYHRHLTTAVYNVRAFNSAKKAMDIAFQDLLSQNSTKSETGGYKINILPVTNRGFSDNEKYPLGSLLFLKFPLSKTLKDKLKQSQRLVFSEELEKSLSFGVYEEKKSDNLSLEALIKIKKNGQRPFISLRCTMEKEILPEIKPGALVATESQLQSEYLQIKLNERGIPVSFKFSNKEFGCENFLETAVSYGKLKKLKRFHSDSNHIEVLRDGSDGFSASIKLKSEFEIQSGKKVRASKILTLYSGIPFLFIRIKMAIPQIGGKSASIDPTSSVDVQFDPLWQEIMPCEIKPNIIGSKKYLKIWKHNFFGRTSNFSLDMKDVDPENADIDCLVANISDGWMALSNESKGLIIGFNSLKASNFAFSPIKMRDRGFDDAGLKGQQIRINPFGTYFGKMLHHWTDGTGHAQEFATKVSTTYQSTAPNYSGKTVEFDLVISPYLGDEPPMELQSLINHFIFPPMIFITDEQGEIIEDNYSYLQNLFDQLKEEYELEGIIDLPYLEWVKKVNKDFDPEKDEIIHHSPKLGLKTMLRMFRDGLKGR